MSEPIITRPDPSAKFLAKFTRGGAGEYSVERLRAAGCDPSIIPSDAELSALWEHERRAKVAPHAANRRQKRAEAAADRANLAAQPTEPPTPEQRAETRRYREKLERRAATWDPKPEATEDFPFWRQVEREVWIGAKDIMQGGAPAVKFHFAGIRNKAAIGAMRRAALCPLPNGGTLRSWNDERARRIAVIAFVMLKLGKHHVRQGAWDQQVRGIPQIALCLLLAYPDGSRVPSRSALAGHHRGPSSRSDRGELGYLPALAAAGFLYRQQWYKDAQPWELSRTKFFIAPDGRKVIPQINRYTIVSDPPKRGTKRAELIELHREGWLCLSERARGSRTYSAVHEDSAENPVYSSVHGPD
jgi:hypothetical protein